MHNLRPLVSSLHRLLVCTLPIFLASLTVAFFLGCQKPKEAAPPPPAVEVMTVIQKDVPVYREWVATMDGLVNATIRAQVSGYLMKQDYREGELVKKGKVLFEIDPRPFQATLAEAQGELARQEASHDNAKLNLARVKPLAEQNALSQKDLDDAISREEATQASVVAAKAAVQKAALNLEFTRITSPIDGIAGIAKAQIGNLVGPGSAEELTTVSTVNPIKVYIQVSEQEYLRTKGIGLEQREAQLRKMPVQLILSDGSIYPHQGEFSLADRQVDVTTGTIKVATLFPNPENLLRPGQFGIVRAQLELRKGALLIPQRAVTELQGKYLVAVVGGDNKADIRQVKVGERIGSDWIIAEGLKPGETVVVEGTQKVKPGMVVAPKPFAPGAPAKQEEKPAAPAAAKPDTKTTAQPAEGR